MTSPTFVEVRDRPEQAEAAATDRGGSSLRTATEGVPATGAPMMRGRAAWLCCTSPGGLCDRGTPGASVNSRTPTRWRGRLSRASNCTWKSSRSRSLLRLSRIRTWKACSEAMNCWKGMPWRDRVLPCRSIPASLGASSIRQKASSNSTTTSQKVSSQVLMAESSLLSARLSTVLRTSITLVVNMKLQMYTMRRQFQASNMMKLFLEMGRCPAPSCRKFV
mmetsp:Transcript_24800/g.68082  ORF Transcript_24800/g.68082 Transcript_24800/m.68082 type:complete len:220 (+) Transcript_24800:550-1209(+)